jgi:hypothetical protein
MAGGVWLGGQTAQQRVETKKLKKWKKKKM